MPVVLFLFFTLFRSLGFADIEIQDPNHILATLPPHRSPVDFSHAFTCFKPVNFFVKTGVCKVACENEFMCETSCPPWAETVESVFQAEECLADSVGVYSSQGRSLTVLKDDYDRSSGSMGLTLIKAISLFYEDYEAVRIDHTLFPYRKNFIENGHLSPLMLTVLSVTVLPDKSKNQGDHLMIALDLQRSGLEQVMCLGSESVCSSNSDYFLKRKGLVNAK